MSSYLDLKAFIAEIFTRALAERSMTRLDLAREIEVDVERIDALLSPDADIDLGTIARAAAALELSIRIDLVPRRRFPESDDTEV